MVAPMHGATNTFFVQRLSMSPLRVMDSFLVCIVVSRWVGAEDSRHQSQLWD